MLGRQQWRRDTAANWASNNPTLADGEVGYDSTNKLVKVGDGSTAWNSLPSFNAPRRVSSTTSTTSWTIDAAVTDIAIQTALAGALTINAPSNMPGTPESLVLRIKDNGTARAITWNGVWRPIGVTLPPTTVLSKTLYVGAFANPTDTKWDVTALAQEA